MQKTENQTDIKKTKKPFVVFILFILILGTISYNLTAIIDWVTYNAVIHHDGVVENQTDDLNRNSNIPGVNAIKEIADDQKSTALTSNGSIEAKTPNFETPIGNILPKYLESYRNFLHVSTHLINNFLQDKKYSDEVNLVYSADYPPHVKSIIIMLEEYNSEYLVNNVGAYKKIFPKDSPMLEKFVRVKKITNESKDQEVLRAKILENLESFINYIYSDELHKIFINRVN